MASATSVASHVCSLFRLPPVGHSVKHGAVHSFICLRLLPAQFVWGVSESTSVRSAVQRVCQSANEWGCALAVSESGASALTTRVV